MATVTVDPNTSYQTFVGWQATAQAGQDTNATTDTDQYPSATFANYDTEIITALIDLGINSVRIEIKPGDVNATGYDPSGNNAAIQPSTATAGQWHYERLARQMDDVAIPLKTALQAQGEDLHICLCVVDFRTAGYDMEDTPSEYSLFVLTYVQKMWDDYGVRPDIIEAILEPNEASNSGWNATKIANNIIQANADLVAAGHTGITWAIPSVSQAQHCVTWYDNIKAVSGSVLPLVSEVYYHRYDTPSTATLDAIADEAEADGISTAMTEYIGANLSIIYNDLIFGRNSTWQQFCVAFPSTSGGSDDGSKYFEVSVSTWAVTPATRTKYLRHFMKYIRRGAVMKGVTNESANYQGVPFRNANGKYVVPIKCAASGDIDVVGLPAGTYGIRYTTGNGTAAPSAYDQTIADQTISGGQNVSFTMPAAGVVTVFDVDYLVQPSAGSVNLSGVSFGGGVSIG